MSILKAKAPRSREKRLDTMNAWQGGAAAVAAELSGESTVQRIRTFSQSSPDDLLYALQLLAGIRNSVTVVHAPRGCAAAGLHYQASAAGSGLAVTNLDERDTIMGADLKLRKAVTALHHRYHPEVIFIVSSPVVAINNDDIQSVVEELHEELEVAIVPVYVSGFASRNAVTGYDSTLHALLKYLGGPRKAREAGNKVNLLSVAEHRADLREVQRLLSELGVELNVLPDTASAAAFREATSARLSIPLDQDTEDYLGQSLRDEYGVPYIEAPRPIGLGATGRWLAAAGAALGLEQEARALHEREVAATLQALEAFTSVSRLSPDTTQRLDNSTTQRLNDLTTLNGVRVYLGLATATAFGVLELVQELGGEVVGITVSHLDQLHDKRLKELSKRQPDLQIHVADGQPFEEVSLLKRLSPDLYLGDAAHLGQIGRLGLPVVSLEETPILGYRGLTSLARRVTLALHNRSFGVSLGHTSPPYQDSWYRRSPNWHIKQEVK